MWCKECNRETKTEKCELCGATTEQDIPFEGYWCSECKTPIIKYANDVARDTCPSCKRTTSYLCADLRPVFPEERLLLEILLGKPLAYLEKSVWASNNRYYIDGKPIVVTTKVYKKYSPLGIRKQLAFYDKRNSYDNFNADIKKFVYLNKMRLQFIIDEAHDFIKETASAYPHQ
jgi:phosphoadenosine phosphosulfate reductase